MSRAARGSDVTVVIATRDRRAELAATLDRLRGLPEGPRVIVVDNGSRDGTARMVRDRFPDVRVVPLRHNLGACARNIGVRHAETPLVAFSDDDSWWEAGALAAAERCFRAHPRLGLLVGRIRRAPDGNVDHVSRKMAAAPLGRDADLPGPSVMGFRACSAVVRRRAFLDAGGFDDLLFFDGAESLLALDLAAAGWGLAYVEDATAWHAPSRHRAPPRGGREWLRLPRALHGTRRLVTRAGPAAVRGGPAPLTALVGLARRLPHALVGRRRPSSSAHPVGRPHEPE
ncbi:glycosyltransferase family 2 protein [Thermomonospora umbrina]|uniref:GT2 family glycosyltransferase n=1 Tax=Thermomonospora umbrina TaxID=111806 RepID=A0A3D9STY6_9ACTN|nr:glycosyltransferase [Thermomonospora umbrina]REE99416.1 GT2 family glycosyltransferase [Thermomonospora umbrina]